MKKLILPVFAAILLAACSSDDDNSVTIDYDQLTRKWYYAAIVVDGQSETYDDHETCGKDYVELLEDGTFFDIDIFGCDAGEPLIDNSETIWVREGNTLTVGLGDFAEAYTIKRLTSSAFEIEIVADYDEDGDTETIVYKFTNN